MRMFSDATLDLWARHLRSSAAVVRVALQIEYVRALQIDAAAVCARPPPAGLYDQTFVLALFTATGRDAGQLAPYVAEMQSERAIEEPSLCGLLIVRGCDALEETIDRRDPWASVRAMYEFAEDLELVQDLQPSAAQLRQLAGEIDAGAGGGAEYEARFADVREITASLRGYGEQLIQALLQLPLPPLRSQLRSVSISIENSAPELTAISIVNATTDSTQSSAAISTANARADSTQSLTTNATTNATADSTVENGGIDIKAVMNELEIPDSAELAKLEAEVAAARGAIPASFLTAVLARLRSEVSSFGSLATGTSPFEAFARRAV
jgi:hypothetical protein